MYEQIKKDIEACNDIIQSRTNYSCGLDHEWRDGTTSSTSFFNSPDGQNGQLFYELKNLGYRNSGYSAEHSWKVSKDGIAIAYSEGDISIYPLKK